MQAFKAPETSLRRLDADSVATLIAAAADIALLIDDAGIIRDVAFGQPDLMQELCDAEDWLGRPWAAVVTAECRDKVAALIRDAGAPAPRRWRHLNFPAADGVAAVPILFGSASLGRDNSLVAFGRDLRPVSKLQRRLVEAQQSVERDYARLRQAESRYRTLFQSTAEPMLVVEAGSLKVVEANPAVGPLLAGAKSGRGQRSPVGQRLPELFRPAGRRALAGLLAKVRAGETGEPIRLRLREDADAASIEVQLSMTLLMQPADTALLLVRLTPTASETARDPRPDLLRLAECAPDAFVITSELGAILTANAAFLAMAQRTSESQVRGELLERWLGQPGVDFDVLAANLRQRGTVRLFATSVRGEFGSQTEVEASAVTVAADDGTACFGFSIRDVGARRAAAPAHGISRSPAELAELIGRVPLKDLVREATDVIERMCIETALELSGDSRTSAAEMLGLSRQSLYAKLRRYGLGDLGGELTGLE